MQGDVKMIFEGLSDKLQGALGKLKSKGKLTEKDVKDAQLKTPELADYKKTHKDRNDNQQSEAKRSTSEIEKNDFIASSETNSIVEFVNIEKPVTII